ncbi:hypothetical protein COCC4DRAFT_30678 [Bipolaris maydis ATCC 48331]|uniref:Uncharacterized protein n=2 Tax=Cochliobolus heterostrophus TaxID=5016 RepID=M2T492_COCH5|nr:uncharacterized protein COCC4DRAFT_30678 [Bipolaris maydis ATCC 48331]EMD92375.1 hypothetical protein COCHEDRAFT_1021179 [Bipolaris maydis C5]ENI08066.1 hypothetical protein COCC4DRAFT_30678 [Bipolaris maydis ATCC 48331]
MCKNQCNRILPRRQARSNKPDMPSPLSIPPCPLIPRIPITPLPPPRHLGASAPKVHKTTSATQQPLP